MCDLPEGVLIIEEGVFEYCFQHEFYFPTSVKYIGKNAFSTIRDDDEENILLYGGTREKWRQIEIEDYGEWLKGHKIRFNVKRN